jgi:hypothetical protein
MEHGCDAPFIWLTLGSGLSNAQKCYSRLPVEKLQTPAKFDCDGLPKGLPHKGASQQG